MDTVPIYTANLFQLLRGKYRIYFLWLAGESRNLSRLVMYPIFPQKKRHESQNV